VQVSNKYSAQLMRYREILVLESGKSVSVIICAQNGCLVIMPLSLCFVSDVQLEFALLFNQ